MQSSSSTPVETQLPQSGAGAAAGSGSGYAACGGDAKTAASQDLNIGNLRRSEKKRFMKNHDSLRVVWFLCGASCVNSLLLLFPVFGNSWASKSFTGLGIKIMTIGSSLFHLEVNVECGKNFMEDELCKAANTMKGFHSLEASRGIACGLSPVACDIMNRLWMTSFVLILFISLAVALHLLGAFLLYHYWFIAHKGCIRRWALTCFLAGPLLSIFGLAIWSVISPDLGDLAKGWSNHMSVLTASEHFSHQSIRDFPFGWCWFWALAVIVWEAVSITVWPMFFHQHELEGQEDEEVDGEESDIMSNMEKSALDGGEDRSEKQPLLSSGAAAKLLPDAPGTSTQGA